MTAPLTRLRRGTAAAAAAAALALAVAACGSATGSTGASATSGQTPLDAVKTGFQALSDSHALTFTVTVDATAAQIAALAKAGGSGSDDTADALAEKLLPGGRIVLEATSGGTSFGAGDAAGGSFSLAVDAGGTADLIQLEDLGGQLYARADVSALAGDIGPSAHAAVQSFVSAQSGRFPFVLTAVDGGWLHVDGSALLGFLKTGSGPDASALSGLGAQLGKDVTATRAAPDPTLGDHLVVTGNVRTLGADVLKALGATGSAVPGAGSLLQDADPASLPDKDVSIDVYVAGGAVDAVKLDVAQLLPAGEKAALDGKPLDVDIAVTRTASVTAPAHATTVSTAQVVQLLGSLGTLGGGSSSR